MSRGAIVRCGYELDCQRMLATGKENRVKGREWGMGMGMGINSNHAREPNARSQTKWKVTPRRVETDNGEKKKEGKNDDDNNFNVL